MKIENKPATWPFLEVRLTASAVPAMALVKIEIKSKKEISKLGQRVWETDFFLLPTKAFGVMRLCNVNPPRPST